MNALTGGGAPAGCLGQELAISQQPPIDELALRMLKRKTLLGHGGKTELSQQKGPGVAFITWHSGLTRDRPKVHLHLDGAVLWNDPDVDRAKPSDGEIPACIAVIKRCRDCLGDQLPTVPQRWKLL